MPVVMPPPMSPPVVAPIATHFARSLIELQADTIPRMATHIRYVPNFLRTLNPSSLATTAASCSGLSETVKPKAESKAELISRREAPQPAMSLHVIYSPTRSYSGYESSTRHHPPQRRTIYWFFKARCNIHSPYKHKPFNRLNASQNDEENRICPDFFKAAAA